MDNNYKWLYPNVLLMYFVHKCCIKYEKELTRDNGERDWSKFEFIKNFNQIAKNNRSQLTRFVKGETDVPNNFQKVDKLFM